MKLVGKLFLTKLLLVVFLFSFSNLTFANWGLKAHKLYNKNHYKLADVATINRLIYGKVAKKILLSNKYHRFYFTSNSKKATYNGIEILLSHPIVDIGGQAYISQIDYNTVILPVVSRSTLRKHAVKTIFLDPGHGGNDVGARGRYSDEKNLTLRLSKKVATLLKAKGFKVVMSRTSDKTVSLDDRVAMSNRYKSDLFISLHFNAATDKSVYGLESYCLTPSGASSSNSSKVENIALSGNKFDRNNFALTYLIQRNMIKQSRALDRGVKHARFLVLKDIQCPATLIECGFISNPASEKILNTDAYLNKLATGIVDAVMNYQSATK